jgi:hypothetical protein
MMAEVAVDFVGAESTLVDSLEGHLARSGVATRREGDTVLVTASSLAECDRLGDVIAAFVATQSTTYPLHMDGPGAETTLYQLRTDEDAKMISGYLAASAFLI